MLKQISFSFIAILSLCSSVSAQSYERKKGSEISVGASGILPMGNFQSAEKFGLGFDLKYAYNFNKNFAVTLSGGYNNFNRKKDYIDFTDDGFKYNTKFNYVPIKSGARFSYQIFYLEPQVGVAIATNGYSTTSFLYAAQVGIMPIKNLDISVRFEGISFSNSAHSYAPSGSDAGMFALRVAYSLPLIKK